MPRRFNTAGPCRPDLHYMIPAERRLPEAPALVEQGACFVVHAPRQTGKTTALRALAERLTASGRYAALHVSCEIGEAAGDDFAEAQRAVLSQLRQYIDALCGQSLISVLRQLRSGFPHRPASFPASVILCGLRDVRDYKTASGGDPERLGTASPFNVTLESLRLGDFSREEVSELYAQYTAETGQAFTEQAVARAFELTQGQPWLVNALAREIVEKMGVPTREPITEEHVEAAKERLIFERATHLDSLVARLKVWREGEKNPLPKGLAQLDEYLERLGLDEGVLVLFDRRKEAGDTEARTRFEQAQTPSGRKVTVLRA